VNHCHSNLPQMVTGQLLGLDVEDTLEVTASFPFIYRGDEMKTEQQEEEYEHEARDYQYEMMRQLREVNVDSNPVGWYCSSWLESELNLNVIETQISYQTELGPNCVCLVYDPLRTTHGKLCLRALRLKDTFMKLYKSQDFTQETIKEKKFTCDDIFEELPLVIHNNSLIDAFIAELSMNKSFVQQAALDVSFGLNTTGYLTKSMESVVDGVDELWQSFQRYALDQKRFKQSEMYGKESDRKPPKPSRLDSLLIGKQLLNHCSYLEVTTLDNFEYLYFADTLQKVAAITNDQS
jgi:translation initiation factor 3 subunit H